MTTRPVSREHGLRDMIIAPTIWAVHFLLCYIVAAVYCAKAGPGAALWPVRLWVTGITIVALAGIVLSVVLALRRGDFPNGTAAPHDADTVGDRRRFLVYVTLLLSGLSFVATLFVALPALFIGTCR